MYLKMEAGYFSETLVPNHSRTLHGAGPEPVSADNFRVRAEFGSRSNNSSETLGL
jgi:hypothetical protein